MGDWVDNLKRWWDTNSCHETVWVSNISETLTEFELLEGEEEDPFLLEEGLQETIVLED